MRGGEGGYFSLFGGTDGCVGEGCAVVLEVVQMVFFFESFLRRYIFDCISNGVVAACIIGDGDIAVSFSSRLLLVLFF